MSMGAATLFGSDMYTQFKKSGTFTIFTAYYVKTEIERWTIFLFVSF